MTDSYLSKTSYCTGMSCIQALWLEKHKPECRTESGDSSQLENGNAVGELARGYLGDYALVNYSFDKQQMADETLTLIRGGIRVICEASFIYGGLFCSVDILRNLGNGDVEIYEVKAENSLKDINYEDAAFQAYVLSKCGYNVVSVNLVYLNSDYVRKGNIDLQELFRSEDVTVKSMEKLPEVERNVSAIRTALAKPEQPFDELQKQCRDSCPYWEYCSSGALDCEPNVYSLSGTYCKKKYELYKQGYISYEQLLEAPKLHPNSRRQIEVYMSGEPYIDRDGISSVLERLSFPLYFLDFETYNVPIPPYDNISPYMQVPFQYSLHYIEHEGGELKHREFLAQAGMDSRRELAVQLCRDIPLGVCTTAYNASFEKGVIRKLAGLYPELAEHLMDIHDRIEDLEIPFSRQYYMLPAMRGRSTIKLVLPALCPDDPALDYHNLEGVHKGTEANAAFLAMADMSAEEQALVRKQLLAYCGLDTLAMVKVWEKLKEAVES